MPRAGGLRLTGRGAISACRHGVYVLRFCKGLSWYYVIMDTKLPVTASGDLVFARCRDPLELWVPFIEKAYAKLHNNYYAIVGGYVPAVRRTAQSSVYGACGLTVPDGARTVAVQVCG